jgi:hypothetical protein
LGRGRGGLRLTLLDKFITKNQTTTRKIHISENIEENNHSKIDIPTGKLILW